MLILAYGVAAIACSLSCSGAEGAAVVMTILGLVGVSLLIYFVIHGIVRESKKDKTKEIKPEADLISK